MVPSPHTVCDEEDDGDDGGGGVLPTAATRPTMTQRTRTFYPTTTWARRNMRRNT